MPVNSDPDRPASCVVLVRSPACELHLLLQETKAIAPTSRNGDPPGKLRPDRLTGGASCLPKLREARSCGLPHVCVCFLHHTADRTTANPAPVQWRPGMEALPPHTPPTPSWGPWNQGRVLHLVRACGLGWGALVVGSGLPGTLTVGLGGLRAPLPCPGLTLPTSNISVPFSQSSWTPRRRAWRPRSAAWQS